MYDGSRGIGVFDCILVVLNKVSFWCYEKSQWLGNCSDRDSDG